MPSNVSLTSYCDWNVAMTRKEIAFEPFSFYNTVERILSRSHLGAKEQTDRQRGILPMAAL